MWRRRRADNDSHLIVGAVAISALGDFLLWIPVTLHLQEMTGSGIAVAALMICLWSPVLLLAPAAGLLADRVETRELGALVVARRVPARAIAAAALVAVGLQGAGLGLPTAWLAAGFAGAMWFAGGVGHGEGRVTGERLRTAGGSDRPPTA